MYLNHILLLFSYMYLNHIQLYYSVLSFQYLEDELYAGPPWRSEIVTEVVTLVKERINNKL